MSDAYDQIKLRIADLEKRLADLVAEEAGVRRSQTFADGRSRWEVLDKIIGQKKDVVAALRRARLRFAELVVRPRSETEETF